MIGITVAYKNYKIKRNKIIILLLIIVVVIVMLIIFYYVCQFIDFSVPNVGKIISSLCVFLCCCKTHNLSGHMPLFVFSSSTLVSCGRSLLSVYY